ncbi:MAG TPA: PilZ domain-containing protein [Sphingomicrobium sp.]|nr:PilZ domain-containing protein [Sphingomicrobium sp.]
MQTGVDWKRYEASDASPCPRRHERSAVEAEASLRRAGKLTFRVRLFDLSPEGCKAEFVERPEIHEQLWVNFDGLEAVETSVCWIAGAKVGLRFLRPMHPAVFDLLLGRLR